MGSEGSNDDAIGWRSALRGNWFQAIQTLGICGSLIFYGLAHRERTRATETRTLLEITRSHREIHHEILSNPALFRVMSPKADLTANPVTDQERLVVVLLVLHLNSVFQASRVGTTIPIEGMGRDVQTFFSLPIPQAVWQSVRHYQNEDFQKFVEGKLPSEQYIYSGE